MKSATKQFASVLLATFIACASASANGEESAPFPSVPRFTHPGAGQTVYFVLTDRFANGDTTNDTGGFPGGTEEHGFDPTRIGYFHGGDFKGLLARLDYLKNLGVTAVWVTPPFQNKPVQSGSAGYHGYWVTDFLKIDPHLGTNEEFREFVRQAHARGMKVYMDIIVNHTADVIHYPGNATEYRESRTHPLRDTAGNAISERDLAYNGFGDTTRPALSAETSFPYTPILPEAEKSVKNPAWLNDATLYHNRGNSAFKDESSVHGDFVGLDDIFTELPQVVNGMIEIFSTWLRDYELDGFRIDTARHVNPEFWQAFGPAIRAAAREAGRPAFVQFGEVYNDSLDVGLLSEFSTHMALDTTIDFGFFVAARNFVSRGGTSDALTDLFQRDDLYTDHDSNIHTTTTFLGNHDAGRFGHFIQQDNPGAPRDLQASLVKLGHGLLFLSRGSPVIYYGDEQGMVGRGGHDMQARETMFPSRAPDFRDAPLLETGRTGADDKFDPAHPFYRFFAQLAALRSGHAALRTGAMIPRNSGHPSAFAFSRIDRRERVEYVVAFNNSRTESVSAALPTDQSGGRRFTLLFDSHTAEGGDGATGTDSAGRLAINLGPLQFAVWRAEEPLQPGTGPIRVQLVNPSPDAALKFTQRDFDGLKLISRQELRAEVGGGDGFAEVTFLMERKSRTGQYEYLGTDDTVPYRIFWRPPPDLASDDELTFTAIVNDLRGRTARSAVAGVKIAPVKFAFGIEGAKTPVLTATPPALVQLTAGGPTTLTVAAEGSGPLEYQWLRNGEEIPGATHPSLRVTQSGRYAVLVRNLAGTTLSPVTVVAGGRVETRALFDSKFVAPRRVDVWLPPGYDADSSARFPVVYMHDGQNLFDPATSYGGVPWSVDEAMLGLIREGGTAGAIVVGVWNTAKRLGEYMPRKAVPERPLSRLADLGFGPDETIQSDAYLKFLVEELKPHIDTRYRTQPGRASTFVMGSSMGGLISAYAMAEYPEVFGGAGCISTHWPAGDGAVIDYLSRNLPKPGAHRIYFDYGTETLDAEYEPYQLRMDEQMRRLGYTRGKDWITLKFEGADHSERSWRERVHLPLKFLLGV